MGGFSSSKFGSKSPQMTSLHSLLLANQATRSCTLSPILQAIILPSPSTYSFSKLAGSSSSSSYLVWLQFNFLKELHSFAVPALSSIDPCLLEIIDNGIFAKILSFLIIPLSHEITCKVSIFAGMMESSPSDTNKSEGVEEISSGYTVE